MPIIISAGPPNPEGNARAVEAGVADPVWTLEKMVGVELHEAKAA